jgi:hypothetical protein
LRYACDQRGACRKVVGDRCSGDSECLSERCVEGTCACTLCLYPEILDLGSLQVGTTHPSSLVIRNRGAAEEGPVDIVLAAGSSGFVVDPALSPGCRGSFASGQTCGLSFQVGPGPWSRSAVVELRRGGSLVARASLIAGAATPGSALLYRSPVDFGATPLGLKKMAGRTLSLSNTGPTFTPKLAIEGRDAARFGIEFHNCSAPLPPSEVCTIATSFQPTQKGLAVARLVVTAGPSTVYAGLIGEGI